MERSSLSLADNTHRLCSHDEWQGKESHGLFINAGQCPNNRALPEPSVSQGRCLLPNCKQANMHVWLHFVWWGLYEMWKMTVFRTFRSVLLLGLTLWSPLTDCAILFLLVTHLTIHNLIVLLDIHSLYKKKNNSGTRENTLLLTETTLAFQCH